MKFFKTYLLMNGVAWMIFSTVALGQGATQNPPAKPTYDNAAGDRSAREAAARDAAMRREMDASYRRMQAAEMRSRALRNRKPGMALPIVLTEAELTAKERKVLEPAPEDLKTYAEFLRQPNTGIFRLMRVDQERHRKVVSADNPGLAGDVLLLGGGAHYSFTKKNHNADKWSDLGWDGETFLAGVGGDALGALVDLGGTQLAELTPENKDLSYLTKFVPATTASAAEQQFQQLEKGVQENGFSYGLSVPWKLDTTYALRSINYGRSDVLVAFRVVRQDSNGSLIVLWKKLKSYRSPNLKKEPKK